ERGKKEEEDVGEENKQDGSYADSISLFSSPTSSCSPALVSFGGEGRRQLYSGRRDAASFAGRDPSISFGEDRRGRARIRGRQPQTQQKVPFPQLPPALQRRAGVQDRVVVNQLYVARTKLHMHIQSRVVCQRVEHIHRLDLTGGEWRNIRRTARRFDVLPLIDRREQSIVPAEDRDEEVRFLSGVHFSAPVSFDRLEQYFCQVGAPAPHL